MNQVKSEEIIKEGLKRQFRITIPAERVQMRIHQLIQERGKTYSEPGFRPGKVKLDRLKALFEESAREKAVPELIQSTARDFLKEQAVTPAFKPEYTLDSYEPEKDVTFSLSFEVTPEIPEISDEGLALKRAKVKVSEEEIEAYMKEWADSHTNSRLLSEERVSQKGDLLRVTMTLTPKGAQESQTSDMDFVLTEAELRPELLQILIGTKPGETVSQEITLPKNTPDRKLAGKKMQATFLVKEIREQFPCEPNEDFATLLKFKNLEEMRERAKQILEKQGEHVAFLWAKRQILDFFARKYTFDVPLKMVDLEYRSIWDQTFHELGISQKPPENDEEALKKRETLFQERVGKSEIELEDFYRKAALRRVRLGFILTNYGKKLGVQVTDKEMQAAFLQELQKYPGEEKAMTDFYRNNPQALNRLQAPVFEDKLLRHIAESKPSEAEEMTMDALQQLIENEEGF